MKAASSDSSDSSWSVVDNNPDNMLVSSFISSAILVGHDPSARPPRPPQATQVRRTGKERKPGNKVA